MWFPSNVLRQRYTKYIHSTTKYIRAVKYQTLDILWRLTYTGHDLSWHAVSRVSGTWHSPTRHVSRHVALWSATRLVSWNITAQKIPRNYSFHAVQGEKHIPASQIIESWVNHNTLSRSGLYIIYYQTSFVSFRSWICNKTIIFHWFYKFDSKLR